MGEPETGPGDAAPELPVTRSADPFTQTLFVRGDGPGFDRAVFFTDAVYAIAMTLIVVALDVPGLPGGEEDSARALLDALGDMAAEIVTFFVTFIVIGQYWIANHRFSGSLRAVDSRLVAITMPYLALVAFLPFPSSLLGEYDANPVAVALFATCMAIVSTLEWVMLRHARVAGLLEVEPSDEGFRWLTVAALSPVVWFAASVGLAFLLGPTIAMLSWLMMIPTGALVERRRPESLRPR